MKKAAQAETPLDKKTEYTYEQQTLHLKMFAWLYFPLQYMIVRCLVLGVELSPSLESIYHGFNIPQIFTIIKDFILNIQGVFTAEHYLFIIFNILPYAVRIAWQLIPAAAFIYAVYTLIVFIRAQISIMRHNYSISTDTYICERTGPPGSGKSSAGGYDIVVMAEKAWGELIYKYHTMKQEFADYLAAGDIQKVLEYYEIRDSYEFYSTHDCIPMLWSNIPIQKNGQFSNRLTYEHVSQVKRIPYGSCLFFDEIGSVLRLDDWRERPLTVADFGRLVRHFAEIHIMSTEQDPTNIYKDWRRVTGDIKLMREQKWVNKPLLLLIPFVIIKKIIIKREQCSKRVAIFMKKLTAVIKHIGQRRYKYVQKQNTQPDLKANEGNKKEKNRYFYLPTLLNYQYDDRTFKNLYLAKDKPIEPDIFKLLTIEDTKENRKMYLKSTDPTKKQKVNEEEAA